MPRRGFSFTMEWYGMNGIVTGYLHSWHEYADGVEHLPGLGCDHTGNYKLSNKTTDVEHALRQTNLRLS